MRYISILDADFSLECVVHHRVYTSIINYKRMTFNVISKTTRSCYSLKIVTGTRRGVPRAHGVPEKLQQ